MEECPVVTERITKILADIEARYNPTLMPRGQPGVGRISFEYGLHAPHHDRAGQAERPAVSPRADFPDLTAEDIRACLALRWSLPDVEVGV